MTEYILSVVSSATVSGLLAAALVFMSKSWISQRIKNAIEHEYAEKLTSYKAQLKAENDAALEKLKASNAQNQAIQAAATASLTATHTAAQEKKLAALEIFWKAMVQLRSQSPKALTFLDILLPKEYDQLLTNPNVVPVLSELTPEALANKFGMDAPDVDTARLYAGEYMFALFWAYRAITGRIAFTLMDGEKKGTIQDWAKDKGIRQLMTYVLTDTEIEEFDALKVGKVNWLRNQIEQKMLAHSARIISGEASATFGLEQAHKIANEAARLEKNKDAQPSVSGDA